MACSRYFPLTVQTRDGWVSLMPNLARQQEPAKLQIDQTWTAAAEVFSATELYVQDIREWQGKMLFPDYRKATLGAVASAVVWQLESVRWRVQLIFLYTI